LSAFLFRRKPEAADVAPSLLIVGLGNPGREYRFTRHNIGFMVIDRLCEDLGIRITRMQSKALIGTGSFQEKRLVLAKPTTFMNLSGQAVGPLVRFYKLPLTSMLVIHDEMDIPFGSLRLRPGGGSSGQKGLTSIIQTLGTQDFPRMRVGVGRPPGMQAPPSFLLEDFTKAEQTRLPMILDQCVDAVKTFITSGLDIAMNQFNRSAQED